MDSTSKHLYSLESLHKASMYNREALSRSNTCGCFSCGSILSPEEIDEWTDDEETAICPDCGVDAILAEDTISITPELLQDMNKRWFLS